MKPWKAAYYIRQVNNYFRQNLFWVAYTSILKEDGEVNEGVKII